MMLSSNITRNLWSSETIKRHLHSFEYFSRKRRTRLLCILAIIDVSSLSQLALLLFLAFLIDKHLKERVYRGPITTGGHQHLCQNYIIYSFNFTLPPSTSKDKTPYYQWVGLDRQIYKRYTCTDIYIYMYI